MRVSELALELGVPTVELLAELSRIGDPAESATSRLDEPVIMQLRREYGVAAAREAS